MIKTWYWNKETKEWQSASKTPYLKYEKNRIQK